MPFIYQNSLSSFIHISIHSKYKYAAASINCMHMERKLIINIVDNSKLKVGKQKPSLFLFVIFVGLIKWTTHACL